jgi:hypothetical protein
VGIVTGHVHPRDVEALHARLVELERRTVGRAHGHGEIKGALRRWEQRPRGWLEAPERLREGRALEERLRVLEHGRRHFQAGLTIPGEVEAYHHLWDPYVRGTIDACAAVRDDKSWGYRRQALLDGWTVGERLSASEAMLTGKDLLALYQHTVALAHEDLHVLKAEHPDIARPSLPTNVMQSVVIGQLEAAGLVARGSLEIVSDSVEHVEEVVHETVKSPLMFVLAGVAGAVLVRSLMR